jgi:hypothetical protein
MTSESQQKDRCLAFVKVFVLVLILSRVRKAAAWKEQRLFEMRTSSSSWTRGDGYSDS